MSSEERIVREANRLFQVGDYAAAKQYYERAAMRYGHDLFRVNRMLCDAAIAGDEPARVQPDQAPASTIQQQLDETQRLLEYYFQRCETLERMVEQ